MASIAATGVLLAWSGCSSSGTGTGPGPASSSGTGTATGGTGGSGGASGLGGAPAFTCVVISPPPSKGACVTFFAPDGGEGDAGVDTMGNATITTCNPLTNAGCIGTDVCGADTDGTNYYCLPAGAPSAVPLCGDCSAPDATCGPGLICAYVSATTARCAALCCTNADCGAGTCDPQAIMPPLPSGVGLCD